MEVKYKGVTYQSQEEVNFQMWVEIAEEHDFITYAIYQPETFMLQESITAPVLKQLKTKQKIVQKSLLQQVTYTPDWKIAFTEKFKITFPANQIYFPVTKMGDKYLQINTVRFDIKAGSKSGNNANNSSFYTFPIKQKFLYFKYQIYVQKIILSSFFKSTFVPEQLAWWKRSKSPRRIDKFKNCPLLKEVLSG